MTEREELIKEIKRETYLGDGLYCSVDDSAQFVLRAPREDGDHYVALDDQVLTAFLEHVERIKQLMKGL